TVLFHMSLTQGLNAFVLSHFAGPVLRTGRVAVVIALVLSASHAISVAAEDAPLTATPKKPSHAPDTIPQVALINEHVRDHWTANKLTPSGAATDGEWCRRVYLDVLGR